MDEFTADAELRTDAARAVADWTYNAHRLAALVSALDGTLTGTELRDVQEELYWAATGLDMAADAVRSFGLDPDNLPEEFL